MKSLKLAINTILQWCLQEKDISSTNYNIFFSRPSKRLLVLLLCSLATFFSLVLPFYQKEFINSLFVSHIQYNSNAIIFLLMASAAAITSYIFTYLYKIISFREGSIAQEKLSSLMYERTLFLKSEESSKNTTGQLISIYSGDIVTYSTLIDDVYPSLISYLLPVIFCPVLIIYMTNINPTSIFLLIIGILILNSFISVKQGKYFFLNKIYSAIRVGYVNEWLQNMRVIRILGWLPSIEQKIKQARITETKNRLQMVTNGNILNSISYSAPFFINILAVYLLIQQAGKNISPGEIFSLLWIFSVILTRPMRMLPILLVSLIDCITSLKRLQDFFALKAEPSCIKDKNLLDINEENPEGLSLKIQNMNLFINEKQILKSINLEIKEGEFIAIIGEIGSGKTMFIQSLLKIYDAQFNTYEINNKNVNNLDLIKLRSFFSYVPQDFFIISSKLRDNITFEYNSSNTNDNEIYNTLELSQFRLENESIHSGLDSEIGERGVNLSGGQKQRIALARAHFANRPFILLDDCLSAVDVNTEEKINQELLNGAWKNKTRILITHRLSILEKCDRIFYMKNGELTEKTDNMKTQSDSYPTKDTPSSMVI